MFKEGGICQRKDGKWCGQAKLGYKANGKPLRKTFYGNTQAEMVRKASFS